MARPRQGRRRAGLNRPSKLVLGLATVSPLFLLAAFFGILAAAVFLLPDALVRSPEALPEALHAMISRHFALLLAAFAALLLAVVLGTAMPLVFVVHALYNARIEEDRRTTWVVALLLGGVLVAPLYWHLYVWRDHPDA